jgi:hypothetical protein
MRISQDVSWRMITMNDVLESLRQAELVVVRRLRTGPLTEFELVAEVAEHSGYTTDQAAERMPDLLAGLQDRGLIWSGVLTNRRGQTIMAAALTSHGRSIAA